MPILAIFTGPKVTKEQYEAVRKEVDWEHRPPEGVIFQAAAFPPGGGIRVADVWTTKEALESFVNKRLNPVLQKLKIEPPALEVLPLHKLDVSPAVDQFKSKAGVR